MTCTMANKMLNTISQSESLWDSTFHGKWSIRMAPLKNRKYQVLLRIWKSWDLYILLLGFWKGVISTNDSMGIPQKIKSTIISFINPTYILTKKIWVQIIMTLFTVGLDFSKHALTRVLKCFDLPSSPLSKGRGEKIVNRTRDVVLFRSSSLEEFQSPLSG